MNVKQKILFSLLFLTYALSGQAQSTPDGLSFVGLSQEQWSIYATQSQDGVIVCQMYGLTPYLSSTSIQVIPVEPILSMYKPISTIFSSLVVLSLTQR